MVSSCLRWSRASLNTCLGNDVLVETSRLFVYIAIFGIMRHWLVAIEVVELIIKEED